MCNKDKPMFKNYAICTGYRLLRDGISLEREPFIYIDGSWYRLNHVKTQPATSLDKILHPSLGTP